MSSWSRTQSRFVAVAPEAVWDLISTPSLWPAFDDAVQRFEPVSLPALTGPGGPRRLSVGDRVRIVPKARVRGALHALTAPPARITVADTDQCLEWRQEQPGGSTWQRWELTPRTGGTLLTRTTASEGRLAPATGPALAQPLAGDLGAVAARLSSMARTENPAASNEPLVIIAGGDGYLGSRLANDLLARGRDVAVLSRHPRGTTPYRQVAWDGVTIGAWAALLDDPRGVDVVNLAGSPIGSVPTAAEVARLRTSRVNSTRALVEASLRAARPVRRWVQGSALGLYGEAGDTLLTEASPHPDAAPEGAEAVGAGYLTQVVTAWEEAASGARAERLNVLRTSVVIDRDAPAWRALAAMASTGAGGPLAGGEQWFSWIHVEDWLTLARAALGAEPGVELPPGALLATAPEPVRNRDLMAALRGRLAPGGLGLPMPGWALGAATRLAGKDPTLLTVSQRAHSDVAERAGVPFAHRDIDQAIDAILS